MKSFIEYIEVGLEAICNDDEDLWVTVDGITSTVPTDSICEEEYPFEASEILEGDKNHEAWAILYEEYVFLTSL